MQTKKIKIGKNKRLSDFGRRVHIESRKEKGENRKRKRKIK